MYTINSLKQVNEASKKVNIVVDVDFDIEADNLKQAKQYIEEDFDVKVFKIKDGSFSAYRATLKFTSMTDYYTFFVVYSGEKKLNSRLTDDGMAFLLSNGSIK